MNILYEENGQFKVATVVSKAEASYQVDTQYGKRVKVKTSQVFFSFHEDLEYFLDQAKEIEKEIDIDFLWEAAGEDEFDSEVLTREYFGNTFNVTQAAALLMKVYAFPIYFYKKGKGRFKAAPAQTLQAAKLAIERKHQEKIQKEEWVKELLSGKVPSVVADDIMRILHMPDKQNIVHQAFLEAADQQKKSPLEFAQKLNLVSSIHQYMLEGFILKNFLGTLDFPDVEAINLPNLPVADVLAFSIDDESTTEIDDAFSLTYLDNGVIRLGIHIAVPTVAIEPDSKIERLVFERLSTVYFPSNKITMLPEKWIDAFTLLEGNKCPAISLYVDIDEGFNFSNETTCLEYVFVQSNLRIQQLEPIFNEISIQNIEQLPDFDFKKELLWLYKLAIHLVKQRGKYKEDAVIQYDYSIDVDETDQVSIVKRARGSPIDLLVSELMIYSNVYWAGLLKIQQLPAIFRGQTTGKARLSSEAIEHQGLGVDQYAWFTAPLRRACDYVNQKQLLSVISAQPVRFKPKDIQVFSIIRSFDTAHAVYMTFQQEMERYWTLRYIMQEKINTVNGVYIKEGLVRLNNLPLVWKIEETPEHWVGSKFKFNIIQLDIWQQKLILKPVSIDQSE
ncbi:ribonuclease catalytic domain-containing protein [Neisseria sp. Ec49-e6-T10]|uniref:ribonuclease catalytic domain-containing protein n=1 Tax=Neisseria sp. Ec49-e6-T10 TaxID=3140744 RepID=UPI003EBD7C54